MRERIRTLGRTALVLVGLAVAVPLAVTAATPHAVAVANLQPTPHCSDVGVGKLPCSWTAGINIYPGDGDNFYRKDTTKIVRRLVTSSGFNSVTIDVPISADNFTDAHVQMPKAGTWEVYACSRKGKSGPAQSYYSPTSKEIVQIGKTVLAANHGASVVIRPMLALGGSCDPADYYPTGRYWGTDFPHTTNVAAFAHFYTGILERLAYDAVKMGHSGRVILDDASAMSCLYDDPNHAGYINYFNRLPGILRRQHPRLPQMFTLSWDFAGNSDAQCGWSGSIYKARNFDQAKLDASFLRQASLVGIDENYPLVAKPGSKVWSASALYRRWQTSRVKQDGRRLTASQLVSMLHADTGREIVLSTIGFVDCSLNPGYKPWHIPSGCNRQTSKHGQRQPSKSQVRAQQNASRAAYCYWSETEDASSPWFAGLWWWDRDFDHAPYINPYDGDWGQSRYGTSTFATLRNFQLGHGSCAGVGGVTINNPGAQIGTVGTSLSLALKGKDLASGGHLNYSASGLPSGLTLNRKTGVVSGTPKKAVLDAPVTVTVVDSAGPPYRSTTFDWTISS